MRLQHYIRESINDKGILKAVFLGGLPAAGKSYTISKISAGDISPRIVNTDKLTELKGAFKPEMWGDVADTAKTLTKKQLTLYLNSLLPLWVDGTSSNPSSVLRRKGILQSIGYDTAMVWVNTSLETSVKRSKQRKREVPEEFIKDVYEKTKKMRNYYSSEFRTFMTIDNDDGELTDKVILKAYRKMANFFNSPVGNPIGARLIRGMKERGEKYLVDVKGYDMGYLKRLVSTWYRQS